MFENTLVDKENFHGEITVTTPGRKPLKTVQITAQNVTTEGTPSGFKKTPKQRLSNVNTPSSRKMLRRRSKRQSVPFPLSKAYSVFDEELSYLTGCGQSQELNEMLREKVLETVTKMRERYEVCLAEKEKHLDKQSCIIAQLKTEMDMLKQDQENRTEVPNKIRKESENVQDDHDQVSVFVQQVLVKAVKELESTNKSPSVHVKQDSPTAPISLVQQEDSHLYISPVKRIDSETSMTPLIQACAERLTTPITHTASETSMTPVRHIHSETSMTPIQHTDALTSTTSLELRDSETTMTPVQQVDSGTSRTPKANPKTLIMSPVQQTNSMTFVTPITQTTSTSMTPIEQVDQDTMVTPVQTYSTAVTTSPLVAVLQPKVISGLPLETLRAELESAAISNELLRSECDELNRKVDDLEVLLTDVKKSAAMESNVLQKRVDCLNKELEEVQEINYQMENKKPHSVEEYEDAICKLQKDILLKEKQIAFYVKKASEADNLQKDLRRMYAKYNAEHQSYTALDQELKKLTEEHKVKCCECESVQAELCDLRVELEQAKTTIDVQGHLEEEAKKNQVKCYVLEEQMETFQCQQKENMEFMEQERKGLEETTVELEQLVKKRAAELEATRLALEERTGQYEHFRETSDCLRTQLSEVEDELNAVQSQAYLVMLEQEKELTTVSRALEEAWGRLTTMIDSFKEQAKKDMASEGDEEVMNQNYRPSLVCSILAAVSGTVAPADTKDLLGAGEGEQQGQTVVDDSRSATDRRDSREFTLVDRARGFNELLVELGEYTSAQAATEQAQMIIQQHLDEIANLQDSLEETKQEYEQKLDVLKQDLENEYGKVRKVQRENENKQHEIESLKLELQTVEENFQTSRERMKELGERYCGLIEQETENEALNDNIRILQRECEKLKKEKSMLEKDLSETIERLRETLETNQGADLEKGKSNIHESFTELFQKKLKLQRECKDLIRVVKKWSNGVEWSPGSKPSSYLLSLLVVQAYEIVQPEMCEKSSADMDVLIEMADLVNDKNLELSWDTDNYITAQYPRQFFPKEFELPIVQDPAIPTHNVAESEIEDWAEFRNKFKEWVTSLSP